MKLIVGLGNPGPRYRETRHNAGFLVVDRLARRRGAAFRKGKNAEEARLDAFTLLVKPTTFMNLSGAAVQGYAAKHGVKPAHILVVHDDLDMPLGRLRFKPGGGGAGGQGGVKDIISRLGPAFARFKIGIGRPPAGWTVEGWVLSAFRDEERELVERTVESAADALELYLTQGLDTAMNRTNGLDLRDNSQPAEAPQADPVATSSQGKEED